MPDQGRSGLELITQIQGIELFCLLGRHRTLNIIDLILLHFLKTLLLQTLVAFQRFQHTGGIRLLSHQNSLDAAQLNLTEIQICLAEYFHLLLHFSGWCLTGLSESEGAQ